MSTIDRESFEETKRVANLVFDVLNEQQVSYRIGTIVGLTIAVSASVDNGQKPEEFFEMVAAVYNRLTGTSVKTLPITVPAEGEGN